jgi:hypothetical protein
MAKKKPKRKTSQRAVNGADQISKVVEDTLKQLGKASKSQEGRAIKNAAKTAQKAAKGMLVAKDKMLRKSLLKAAKASDPLGMFDRGMLAGVSCGDVCTPSCAGGCAVGCLIGGGTTIAFGILGGTAGGGTVGLGGSFTAELP